MLRLLRQISLRQLGISWGRTSLVIGGIAVGVSLIVAIRVINTTVLQGFRRTIETMAGPAQLQVTLGIGEVGFEESSVDIVRTDPDVVAAVPLVRGTISFADRPEAALHLFGADFVAEEDLQRYHVRAVTNRRELLRSMEDPRSILITQELAAAGGIEVGTVVPFLTPQGVQPLTVRGLLEAKGVAAALAGQLAVMDLPAAQLLLAKKGRVDQIDVRLRPEANVVTVRDRLAGSLPAVLEVSRPAQRGAQYDAVLSSFQSMLTGLSTLCLIAGIFIIYNTTSTGAIQRVFVINGLRLIGATRRQVFWLLMVEALILGAAGSVVGVAVGIPLARLLTATVTGSMGVIFQLRFPVESLAVDVPELALILMLGVGVALFASSFAARQLTNLDALEVMHSGVPSAVTEIRSSRLVIWWLLMLGTAIAAFGLEDHFKSIAWGNFGSTLWNASVIVIALPVVHWVSGILRHWLPRLSGPAGHVAASSLFRGPVRTGVTVAAIALVLTVAIALSSLVESCRTSLRNYFAGQLAADLVVSAIATEGGWLETPLPGEVGVQMQDVPGVRALDMGRIISGQFYRGQRIGLLALTDAAFAPSRYPPGWFREGTAEQAGLDLKAGQAVMISVSLSDRFDLHLGDEISLQTPTGVLTRPIVGVVPDYISDRGSVILNRRLFVERWGDTSVSRIHVFLSPGASAKTVRERIIDRFGDRYRLKVLSMRELLDYHTDMIDRAFAVMNSVQLLIIIVTVVGIFDLLVSRIVERRRELGLWRLIGADIRTVRRSVIVESATIGAMGAVMGVAVGIVTAWIWVTIHFRELLGYYVEYHFALGATLWYVILVIVTTAAAGYAAASRATQEDVLKGIQAE